MTRVYVIGDTHFGHRGIGKYRPDFPTVEENDNYIHGRIMSVANKRDILWLLGDNFFEEYTLKFLKDYNKHFKQVNWVIGNHDTDKPHRIKLLKEIVKQDLVYKIGSLFKMSGFWISHHPIHPNELWGKKNIHGHVHNITIPDNMYLNVSCDNLINYTPADIQWLKNMKLEKSLKVFS